MAGPNSGRLPDGVQGGIHRYRMVRVDPNYPQYFPKGGADFSYLGSHGPALLQANWCKVLDIPPDATVVHQNVLLESATPLPILLRDPAGKPLSGVRVKGVSPVVWWNSPFTCATDSCAAYDVEPGKPRLLVFFEPSRKLAATVSVTSDAKTPIVVTLRPAGILKGRLVDEEGSPLAGVMIRVNYRERTAEGFVDYSQAIETGADGTFVIDTMLPGMQTSLSFHRRRTVFTPALKPISVPLVDSGETKDLGTIALKPRMNGG
jgi:hypothetical protein